MGDLRRPGVAVALLQRRRRPLVPGRPRPRRPARRRAPRGPEHGRSRNRPRRSATTSPAASASARAVSTAPRLRSVNAATSARSTSAPSTDAAASTSRVASGQPVQPPGHHGADARWRGVRRRRRSAPAAAAPRGRTGCHRSAGAAGRPYRRRRGSRAPTELTSVATSRGPEPTQADVQPVADQVGQGDGQGVRRIEVGVPVGADDRQPARAGVPGQELQQPDRALVGPVQVVQDEHQRSRGGGGGQSVGDRIEQLEAGIRPGLGRPRPVEPGDRVGHGLLVVLADGANHLPPRPVRRRPVTLPAGGPHRPRRDPRRQLGDEAGLADPRLAGDQDEHALAEFGRIRRRTSARRAGSPDRRTAGARRVATACHTSSHFSSTDLGHDVAAQVPVVRRLPGRRRAAVRARGRWGLGVSQGLDRRRLDDHGRRRHTAWLPGCRRRLPGPGRGPVASGAGPLSPGCT